jgi:hypothetical protein
MHRKCRPQYFLRMGTAGACSPRKWLRMAKESAVDVHLRDDLLPVRVLRTHDVDCREQGRDHREQARVSEMTTRADATPEAKARRTGVADSGVDVTRRSQIPLRLERFRIGVIFWVV